MEACWVTFGHSHPQSNLLTGLLWGYNRGKNEVSHFGFSLGRKGDPKWIKERNKLSHKGMYGARMFNISPIVLFCNFRVFLEHSLNWSPRAVRRKKKGETPEQFTVAWKWACKSIRNTLFDSEDRKVTEIVSDKPVSVPLKGRKARLTINQPMSITLLNTLEGEKV